MLSLIEAPDEQPITRDEAKAHARVEIEEDDFLIDSMIAAATDFGEWLTQRAFVKQTWELRLDHFPKSGRIELPKPPLLEVVSISYIDTVDVEHVVDAGTYQVIAPKGPRAGKGFVSLRAGATWPTGVSTALLPIVVVFTAGYGTIERSAEFVPYGIKAGLLEYVAESYENRENTVLTGAILQEVPFSVKQRLWPFVVDKFGI